MILEVSGVLTRCKIKISRNSFVVLEKNANNLSVDHAVHGLRDEIVVPRPWSVPRTFHCICSELKARAEREF